MRLFRLLPHVFLRNFTYYPVYHPGHFTIFLLLFVPRQRAYLTWTAFIYAEGRVERRQGIIIYILLLNIIIIVMRSARLENK
jgi:hypothetical protein